MSFTIKLYLHLNYVLMLNCIELFLTLKLITLNCIVIYNCLNKLNSLK